LKAVWSPGPWCYHAAAADGGGRSNTFGGLRHRAYNVAYFHLRHPQALGSKAALAKLMMRQFVLNRANLSKPWRLPGAIWDAGAAYTEALSAMKMGPALPLRQEELLVQEGGRGQ
jgi:hypothetical protein